MGHEFQAARIRQCDARQGQADDSMRARTRRHVRAHTHKIGKLRERGKGGEARIDLIEERRAGERERGGKLGKGCKRR